VNTAYVEKSIAVQRFLPKRPVNTARKDNNYADRKKRNKLACV